MAQPVDPVGQNAPAGHEERRQEEDLSDCGRVSELLAEGKRDDLVRHEYEGSDDQRRHDEPEEEEPPHGAAG